MHHPGRHDPAPAGKVRRGRVIFQLGFEHGLRAARDGDVVSQDYDWRCRWFLPIGVVSLAAGNHRHEFGPAIRVARTSTATVAGGDAASIAIACDTRGPTDIDGSDAGVAAAVKEEIAHVFKANVRQTSVCHPDPTS